MVYIYTAGFAIVGIYLIYNAIKEYRFLFIPGIYFIFLGVWRLCNELNPYIDLMSGIYAWILRIISLAVLLVTGFLYYNKYKKS